MSTVSNSSLPDRQFFAPDVGQLMLAEYSVNRSAVSEKAVGHLLKLIEGQLAPFCGMQFACVASIQTQIIFPHDIGDLASSALWERNREVFDYLFD